MSEDLSKHLLAFLGPLGTYSHQAAFERFGASVEYAPCETIADVYDYRSSSGRQVLHLLPFENSKNGIVLETLNLLLLRPGSSTSRIPKELEVLEELRTQVRHCLIIAEGGDGLDGIEEVQSHEQALAQCQKFLSRSLPKAKRVPVSSTALAALSLLPSQVQGTSTPRARSAAICSSVVADIYPGLTVLKRGIEDKTGNTTRFLLLGTSSSREFALADPRHPSALLPATTQSLVAFSSGLNEVPSLSDILTSLPGRVLSLDRRPESVRGDAGDVAEGSSDGGGFRSRYLALVESSVSSSSVSAVEAKVGDLVVLGRWLAYR